MPFILLTRTNLKEHVLEIFSRFLARKTRMDPSSRASWFIFILIAIFFYTCQVLAGHYYFSGRIESLFPSHVVVNGKRFILKGSPSVFKIKKEGYGKKEKFVLEKATIKDLRPGHWVTLKVEGNEIREILWESYQ